MMVGISNSIAMQLLKWPRPFNVLQGINTNSPHKSSNRIIRWNQDLELSPDDN